MPDDPTPSTPQAGNGGSTSPQAGTTTPSEPQAGDEPISLDEARKLRKENQTLRQRQKAIDDEKAAREAAQLSELEKATKRTQELEATIKQRNEKLIDTHVRMAAQDKGVHKDLLDFVALKLIKEGDFDFDDEHFASAVEKALDALIKERPALTQQAQPPRQASSGGATNPGRQQAATGGAITREFVQNMTAAQYQALSAAQKEEVQTLLRTMRGH